MSEEKESVIYGQKLVIAIEKLLLDELRTARRVYEASSTKMIQEFALELEADPAEISALLKVLLSKRNSLKSNEEARAKVLEVVPLARLKKRYRLWDDPDDVARYLLTRNFACGWGELADTKIRRSNIHTVLKTLDPIWQDSVSDEVLQLQRETVRANAEAIMAEEIEDESQYKVWTNKVLLHFKEVLVYKNFDKSIKKPAGTIYADQFRSYRRNWQMFTDTKPDEIMNTARELKPEELDEVGTRFYTQGKVSRADQLTMRFREIMREEMSGLNLPETALVTKTDTTKGDLNLNGYKITVSLDHNKSLQAEKIWADRSALESQSTKWLDSILFLWDQPSSKVTIAYEANDGEGRSRIAFAARTTEEAISKLSRLIESSNLD